MESLERILFDLIGIDREAEQFVICGANKGFTNSKGNYIKGLNDYLDDLDVESFKKESKKRIGKKFYTYDKSLNSIDTGYCARVGLWIPKGYIVIDCDTKEDTEIVMNYLETNDIETPIIQTSKGIHVIFKFDGEIKQTVKSLTNTGAEVDYRTAEHGYIVLPINDTDRSVLKVSDEVAELPSHLLPVVDSNATNKPKNTIKAKGGKISEGSRNDTIFRMLCKYVSSPMFRNEETLLPLALGLNSIHCEEPLSFEELQIIVKSVIENYQPLPFIEETGKYTVVVESLLAKQIEEDTGYKRYLHSDFIYNGTFYEKLEEKTDMQKIIKNYIEMTGNNVLVKMKTIDETLKQLKIDNSIKEVDSKKFIAVENGLINIEDYSIIPHTRDHITFFKVPCVFESIETSLERFEGSALEKYLTTTFKGDSEVINVVQEVLGMSLKPNPKLFQKAVVLSGSGSNGKSLFINLLKSLHGNNISSVPFSAIDNDKQGQNFDLYNMIGKNVNIDADASGARIKSAANFKKITSGDNVQLTKKQEQASSGILEMLLILCMNELPSTADRSDGYYRRWAIIPFNQQFKHEREIEYGTDVLPIDFTLEKRITENEMDILLAFALKGLERVVANNYKLSNSSAIQNAEDDYRLESDSVEAFYKDITTVEENKVVPIVGGSVFYSIYTDWCNNSNKTPVTMTAFGKAMKQKFAWKSSNGIKYLQVPLPPYEGSYQK